MDVRKYENMKIWKYENVKYERMQQCCSVFPGAAVISVHNFPENWDSEKWWLLSQRNYALSKHTELGSATFSIDHCSRLLWRGEKNHIMVFTNGQCSVLWLDPPDLSLLRSNGFSSRFSVSVGTNWEIQKVAGVGASKEYVVPSTYLGSPGR